ncbi:hypothetical protein L2716_03765 [Alkalihalobacillus berkeleyi]|uniref:Uncharacterized protein n=1 Tax=Pseudalkalibacillus berkeleyi TaxID=1069813 RepID=A0ABS9GVI5_9BACL|nr:hypothetical protein [Pseudalkalibacillus berkeleyi]
MFRLFILIIGFSFAVSGGVSLIAFLNLITTGHGFVNYIIFISTRPELSIFIIGLALIWGSIYLPSFSKDSDE